MGRIRRRSACTHGPQVRKRSATAWSVMEEDVNPLVLAFLQQRGRELSEEKTSITHLAGVYGALRCKTS